MSLRTHSSTDKPGFMASVSGAMPARDGTVPLEDGDGFIDAVATEISIPTGETQLKT